MTNNGDGSAADTVAASDNANKTRLEGQDDQPPAAKKAKTTTLTESEVYDRQIRLWGADSQAKIQKAKVLYIHISGLTAEVLKNMVLAGISATIFDPRPAQRHLHEAPNFFTPPSTEDNPTESEANGSSNGTANANSKTVAQAAKPLIDELNLLLGSCPVIDDVKSVDEYLSSVTVEDLSQFSVIMASQISLPQAVRLSQMCVKAKTVFYLADCFGFYGATLVELGSPTLQYRPEQGKDALDPVPLKEYVSFEDMIKVPLHQSVNRFHKTPPKILVWYRALLHYQQTKGVWPGDQDGDDDFDPTVVQDFLKDQQATLTNDEVHQLGRVGMAQVVPVCSVLGGLLGNEIIKIISGKGLPVNNSLLFDGIKLKAWNFMVKPKEEAKKQDGKAKA